MLDDHEDKSVLLASLKIGQEASMPTSKSKGLLIGIGLILLVSSLTWFYQNQKDIQVTIAPIPSGVIAAPIVQPDAEIVSAEPLAILETAGYITARTQATISSKVTGRVAEVYIEEGQLVEKGELLASLDSSLLITELDLVQAQFNAENAGLAEFEVELQQAQLKHNRIQLLAKKSLASQADLDQARLNLEGVSSRMNRHQQEVKVAAAKIQVVQQKIQNMQIRAPFSGVVIAKSAQAGEMISPVSAGGGFTRTGICTLVDMNSLEIIVDVNESNIQKISVGQKISARLNSYQDWEIPARLLAIIPAADRNKATVRVRIELLELDPRILPDMGVKVAFIESTSY